MAQSLNQRAKSKRGRYFDRPNIEDHLSELQANVNPQFPGGQKAKRKPIKRTVRPKGYGK